MERNTVGGEYDKYATGRATMKLRIENVMLDVQVESAIIDFADILDAVRIQPDNDAGAPWDDTDCWPHAVENVSDEYEGDYFTQRGRRKRILVNPDNYGWFEYLRERGASKQVAREYEARQIKAVKEQLFVWHNQGYEVWGILCEFKGALSACWGYIGDVEQEDKEEIADEVARELEGEGYTIINRPDRKKAYRENRIHSMRRRLQEQN